MDGGGGAAADQTAIEIIGFIIYRMEEKQPRAEAGHAGC